MCWFAWAEKNFNVIHSELKTLSESYPASDRDLDKEFYVEMDFISI